MVGLEVCNLNVFDVHAADINECSKCKVSGRNDWASADD